MNDTFEIPVIYKGQELSFPSKLLILGYTYKIAVAVNGTEVLFEPDEERKYRAVIDQVKAEGNKKIDVELLKTIAAAIEAIVE